MNIDCGEAKSRGYGNYTVIVADNLMVRMRDGTHLSAKIWFPEATKPSAGFEKTDPYVFYDAKDASKDESYPSVLEYIPYRKNDYTAERDYLRHPWLASHGYVIMRVDMRGSGEWCRGYERLG